MEYIQKDGNLLCNLNTSGIVDLVAGEWNDESDFASHREDFLVDELVDVFHYAASCILKTCNIYI